MTLPTISPKFDSSADQGGDLTDQIAASAENLVNDIFNDLGGGDTAINQASRTGDAQAIHGATNVNFGPAEDDFFAARGTGGGGGLLGGGGGGGNQSIILVALLVAAAGLAWYVWGRDS